MKIEKKRSQVLRENKKNVKVKIPQVFDKSPKKKVEVRGSWSVSTFEAKRHVLRL